MLDTAIILASLGFILAIISFISGLQVVRIGGISVESKIHRVNGYITFVIFLILATLSLGVKIGITPTTVALWSIGLLIILTKVWIVRSGRAYKFGGWLGALLVVFWLVVMYIHAPI